jgi:hypothetical protein
MEHLCTCYDTRNVRQKAATRLGIKAKKRREIRGGSPAVPFSQWSISIGFVIVLALMTLFVVAGIATAIETTGPLRIVAFAFAVAAGLYLAWIGLVWLVAALVKSLLRRKVG